MATTETELVSFSYVVAQDSLGFFCGNWGCRARLDFPEHRNANEFEGQGVCCPECNAQHYVKDGLVYFEFLE